MTHWVGFLGPAIALLACCSSLLLTPGNAVALRGDSERTTLEGHVPAWASAANFERLADDAAVVHARLHFGYNDRAAVEVLATEVSDPASASYGAFLSVQEFTERFAPLASHLAAVQAYMKSQGLRIAYTATNRKYIAIEGTVAQFSAMLDVTFGMYNVKGMSLRSPQSEPRLLSFLFQGHRLHFVGLDQGWAASIKQRKALSLSPFNDQVKAGMAVKMASASEGAATQVLIKDCVWSDATTYVADLNFGVCGYKPSQVRSGYAVPTELTGSGQTVAVVDAYASPFIQDDLDAFSAQFDIPSTTIIFEYPPFDYDASEHVPPSYDEGWGLEESLDVEVVHGVAPNATIIYLGAASSSDADLESAINYVLEYNLSSLITNSWGGPLYSNTGLTADMAAIVAVVDDILMQAATLGIGVYFSSGDYGDDSEEYFYANYDDVTTPDMDAASPWAIAVGGTTLALGTNGSFVTEYGWGEKVCSSRNSSDCYFYAGSGGGVAYTFPTPSYQAGNAGVQSILASQGYTQGRVVPDVAALADSFTGYFVAATYPDGDTYQRYMFVIGGTSLACPAFTAMVALAQEQNKAQYGFANPLFYSKESVFRDILPSSEFAIYTAPELEVFAVYDESLVAQIGYDNITGLGTPGPSFWTSLSSSAEPQLQKSAPVH